MCRREPSLCPTAASEEALSVLLIVLLGWDDPPDATSWVLCVASSSWNEMNVAMEDGLPSLFASVDSDIKGGHVVIL